MPPSPADATRPDVVNYLPALRRPINHGTIRLDHLCDRYTRRRREPGYVQVKISASRSS
jgi:hypothetical protein